MLNVRAHVALGLVLSSLASASLVLALPGHAAARQLAAPAPTLAPAGKTSSAWLRTGEAHLQKGENVQAGEAFRNALEALSPQSQKANEGARAAMLSADAHWLAFEQDLDVIHLQAALDVLNLWRTLTGPRSRASAIVDVERKISRIQAVHGPLGEAREALAAGDAKKALDLHVEAVDALTDQGYEWPLRARVVLRASAGCVSAYESHVKGPEDIPEHLPGLRAARDLLIAQKQGRPADDASDQGPAVDQALADVEARIAEAEQALADDARAEELRQQQREAEQAKQIEEARRAAEQEAAERERKAAEARKQRKLAIGLLAGGVVAVGGGAGLLGEGIAWGRASQGEEDESIAGAEALAPQERQEYDAALQDWREGVDRRNLGFIVGGSVLAAGGLAMSIYGIVKLAQGRRPRGSTQRAHLRPGPFLVNVEF